MHNAQRIINAQQSKGFTLLEMVISMGIFSVVVVTAIGIMLGVSNAQIKSSNTQVIQDNIRFSMEAMTKEIRTGTDYIIDPVCGGIFFLSAQGELIRYYLSDGKLLKLIDSTNCAEGASLLSDEVTVERLFFKVRGGTIGPTDGQPLITISIKLRSISERSALASVLNLQTTIVQRLRDL